LITFIVISNAGDWLGDVNLTLHGAWAISLLTGARPAAHDRLTMRTARVVVAVSLSLALGSAATAQELLSFHGRALFIAGHDHGFRPR